MIERIVPDTFSQHFPALPVERRRMRWEHWAAMLPSILALGIFIYGFVIWTTLISFSASQMVPDFTWVGLANYTKMWRLNLWDVSIFNLVIFSVLYIAVSMAFGLVMAILVDQKIVGEAIFRSLFLYPAAVSFVVTGLIWKWLLNPGIGIEAFVHSLGLESFKFDWIIRPQMVIYALVIAGVWQVSGFAMALFLAGLRSVDNEIVRAATLDGANVWRLYISVIIPTIKPVFLSVFVLLAAFAIKTFDLVVTMTAGGPGYASNMPANFMYEMAFHRNQLGVSSASAVTILLLSVIVIVPYLVFMGRRRGAR